MTFLTLWSYKIG